MAGLYFHIPFCKRICAYCDFYHTADLRTVDATLEGMMRELEARHSFLGGAPVRTRYFGGGTPSLLPPRRIGELLDAASRLLDCSAVAETTLEANPDDLDGAYLEALLERGVDRLSIGVQSLDDACLRLMNRRHTAAQAVAAVRRAQEAGFSNLSVDLIFGVPGFGGESLRRSLDGVIALGVGHISAYHLTVEPATAFGRQAAAGRFRPVDEAVSEREFATVHAHLTDAGYEHYEVSSYALPGFRSRHNAAYWQGEPYLGIGPAAHSFDGLHRMWNPSLEAYLAGAPPDGEVLTERDRYNETLMTRLRTSDGLDLRALAARFGRHRTEKLLAEAAPSIASGNLVREGSRLCIPPERFLLSDAVIAALFEAGDETGRQC